MTKWEYKIETTNGEDMDTDMELLNDMGSEGWELVQVVNTEVYVDSDNGQETEDQQDTEVVEILFNYFFKRTID